jgi:hypothetical protein
MFYLWENKRSYNTKYKVEEIALMEDNAMKTLKNRRNW